MGPKGADTAKPMMIPLSASYIIPTILRYRSLKYKEISIFNLDS